MTWTIPDAVDYKGYPADSSKTGGWVPAALILGMFICLTTVVCDDLLEKFTYLKHLFSVHLRSE